MNDDVIALIGGEQKHQSVKTDGVCTTLCSSMGTGGGYIPMIVKTAGDRMVELKRIGNIYGKNVGTSHAGNVYDKNGLAPTLDTAQGGNRQPMIIDELKTIVAMRGRNPENPSDRTAGIKTEQRLEPNGDGLCNTLTSVQKDNLLLEEKPECINLYDDQGKETSFQDRGYKTDKISPAITTSFRPSYEIEKYRIRKLTPKECWRLMGFSDEDFEKAAKVNSNTQLYKQAGNSIVKDVLMAIFRQMID